MTIFDIALLAALAGSVVLCTSVLALNMSTRLAVARNVDVVERPSASPRTRNMLGWLQGASTDASPAVERPFTPTDKAAILEWHPLSDELKFSSQAAKMLGLESQTVRLSELLDRIANEDRPSVQRDFDRARTADVLDTKFRVGPEAGRLWVEIRGTKIDDAAGEPRVFATLVDATQRYAKEAEVGRLEGELRAAIDTFSGPFALWDRRRRLLSWNASFVDAFGLGGDVLRAHSSYDAVAAAAASGIRRTTVDPQHPDVRIVELASGAWLQLVEQPTSDGGVLTIGVDVTALKRREEDLTRAIAEQRAASSDSMARSAFLANMSHELRTPLNAVIGFSEIIDKQLFGPVGNEQYRQYAADIFASGTHLLDLINDILDMAKIEAGKLTLSPRPLDLKVIIDEAVRLTKRRAEEKGLSITADVENVPEIEGDRRAIKQMLLNLLSNAVKFTDEGAIMVQARRHAGGVAIRVVDTGRGIPADRLPRLARPFEQAPREDKERTEGTGLGLALTKSLAEMHGGRLSIQSEVGRGTIVTIFLPSRFGVQSEATDDRKLA